MPITRQDMLALPRPTPAQWQNMLKFLPSAHSWYKASLFTGRGFVVYLDPDAADKWAVDWNQKQEYLSRYGYLTWEWTFGEYSDKLGLPPELVERCSFVLFPWGAQRGGDEYDALCGDYYEDDWAKLEAGHPHPAREQLLKFRHTCAAAGDLWNKLSVADRHFHHENISLDAAQIEDRPQLREWKNLTQAAEEIFGLLADEELPKVENALHELKIWLYGE
jgi:hypothetical protein